MLEYVVVVIGFFGTKLEGYLVGFFRRLQKRIYRRKLGWTGRSLRTFAKSGKSVKNSHTMFYTMRTTHSAIPFFFARLYHVVNDELKLIYF